MSRIASAFEHGKAFIAFVTGGDPSIEVTEQLIRTMASSGADLIEIGIPFSDPIAEGPVIQEASERALAAGCTTDLLFDMVARLRKDLTIPLVFMTYANPVFAYGKEKFMKRCKECGIDGLIIPDTPFEERDEFLGVCEKYDVDLIAMVAPTSTDRAKTIASSAKGFLYCVSSLGVTGIRTELKNDIGDIIQLAKSVTDTPCAIGFGISTPEQAKQMSAYADGVIVGSAIVKIVAEHGADCIPYVKEYVSAIKKALM